MFSGEIFAGKKEKEPRNGETAKRGRGDERGAGRFREESTYEIREKMIEELKLRLDNFQDQIVEMRGYL